MNKLDCLGLGIAPADILMGINKFPRPGVKIDASGMVMQGGGPVPTAMVTLARLGLKAVLLAVVGDDILGQFVVKELKKEKVDTSYIIIKKNQPTAVASGWFEKNTGRRTIVLELSITLNAGDIKLSKLPKTRLVHLDGRYLPACLKLAGWARRRNIPVAFDIGSMRNDVTELLPLVDHLVCAQDYAFPYTGANNAKDAIIILKKICKGTIVVTSGINGSLGYAEDEGFVSQKAFKVRTVDTTGAGDVYHGAYLFALLNGYNLQERLKFASAAAAMKCTLPGGRIGIPDLKQLQHFLKKDPHYYA